MATPARIEENTLPTVALVGRTNVGKSTLFNKLIEEQKAIVSKIPGTTRTSNEGVVLWRGKEFRLIDTGGLTFEEALPFEEAVVKQTEYAMDNADIIVMVTDAEQGILPQEKELVARLKKIQGKPILLAVNKVDNDRDEAGIEYEALSKLNLGEPFPISAANGRRVGDFLDLIHALCGKIKKRPKAVKKEKQETISVGIIGKPNVGKSSLFNKLIGEEKVIVSDIPHTTREPHDTLVSYEKRLINFVDTAGIRRKAKVAGELERLGIAKSIDAIGRSGIILFVLDGSDPISSQDKQLGGLLEQKSKSVIILINKWDLAEEKSDAKRREGKTLVYNQFPHLKFAPIMFVSGKTGYAVHDIFPMMMKIWQARHTEVSDTALEAFLKEVQKRRRPVKGKGTRHPKLYGLQQIGVSPPVFELFMAPKTSIHRSYVNFLENRLREQYDFLGVPIVIKLTKMKR
ncbi:MAG: ribosome biogenesis GTPase Der [Candidatus Magasanikbacteria bacterium RIFCSPHIGHO2_02_FULL_51_14]|uniref:GTPase Der n=1 Tax=Candidatus Magasanikbacteria bacterium RIFCSPHIGHO2_02_FULL_51_14 TaxID=1798683 RepID=A0A1F6MQ71_9BACT|nr:MAG: ribosome biogenesis GTPase Der [Candidatus Magasanikbacteria bacterium RIFCSPHIGHO2_02_FULL_51_14]